MDKSTGKLITKILSGKYSENSLTIMLQIKYEIYGYFNTEKCKRCMKEEWSLCIWKINMIG